MSITWESLARRQAERFNKNAHGMTMVTLVEQRNRIDVTLHATVEMTYPVTDWESAYSMVMLMCEAYIQGFRWGLQK